MIDDDDDEDDDVPPLSLQIARRWNSPQLLRGVCRRARAAVCVSSLFYRRTSALKTMKRIDHED